MNDNDIAAVTGSIPARRIVEICGGTKITNWEHISLNGNGIRLAAGTPLGSLVDAVLDESTGEWVCQVWLSEKRTTDFSLMFFALSVIAEVEEPVMTERVKPNIPVMDNYQTFERWEAEAAFTVVNSIYGVMVDARVEYEKNKLEKAFNNFHVEKLDLTNWVDVFGSWEGYHFEFFQNEINASLVIMDRKNLPLWQGSVSLLTEEEVIINGKHVEWEQGGFSLFDTVSMIKVLSERLEVAGFKYLFIIPSLTPSSTKDDVREIVAHSRMEAITILEKTFSGLKRSEWTQLNEDKRKFPSKMPVFS